MVIIDNMMNLEMLEWCGGEYDKIARTHANTTLENHFRPDNSSYHVSRNALRRGVRTTRRGRADNRGDCTAIL